MTTNPLKAHILITGGTGLVGGQLTSKLIAKGYFVSHLSREQSASGPIKTYQWNPAKGFIDENALENVDFIIHLAGAGVAEKRWTSKRKELLYTSRVDAAQLILDKLRERKKRLTGFISASAVGIYGYDTGDTLVSEEQKSHATDFLSDLVEDWESVADQFNDLGARVVKLRIGLVLSPEGGLLEKLKPVVKYGLAAPFGTGRQYMSWIHIDDLVNMFVSAIEIHELVGAYNAVAPKPVNNIAFIKILAKVSGKPCFLPGIPKLVLGLALGEMAQAIAGGNNVSSKKIQETGFRFQYPELEPALRNLLKK